MLVAGLSDGDTQLVDAVATTIGGPLVSASLKGDCKTYG